MPNSLRNSSKAANRLFAPWWSSTAGGYTRTALSLLRSPEEAEDMVQEVFVEVYQTVGRFWEETSLST